ncbi:MAG TPA: glycosyltransferase family 39 protein [Phycisphaerae bacterium]|nr:glycosyltransferase family 39 protein [Phycisphaerae bacterium]HNU45608.1 glycosyltransferase family 39 protein [Phycisphaerae bacterium]
MGSPTLRSAWGATTVASAPRRTAVWGGVLCAFWVVALVGVGTWATYWVPQRTDQYQLIHFGKRLYEGGRLYVDCWENKPPGMAWINLAGVALSQGGQFAAWVLPAVAALLSLALAATAMRRTFSVFTARVALLLMAVVVTLRMYDTPSINPDFYSAMFELAAFSVLVMAWGAEGTARRLAGAFLAGLLWAAAATVKQTGAMGLLGITAAVAIGLPFVRDARARRVGTLAGAWTGLLLGLAVVVAVLAGQHVLAEAREATFSFNRGLSTWEHLQAAAMTAWHRRSVLDPLQLPLWLGLLGVVATLWTGGVGRLGRPEALALLLWWAGQLWLAAAGPCQAERYWQATFPALFWAAAAGVHHLEIAVLQAEKPHRPTWTVTLGVLVLVLGRPLLDHYSYGLSAAWLAYTQEPTQRAEREALGREVAEVVPPGAPMYVWAYRPDIYLYADRPAACRFTHPLTLEQMAEILDTVESGKAHALLIPRHRAPEFDAWCDAACIERREAALTRYEMKATCGPFEVWLRRDTPPDSAP